MLYPIGRVSRRFLILGLLGAVFGVLVSEAQSNLVLPEDVLPQIGPILTGALAQAPRLMIRNAESAAAEADLVTAKSARLPNVSTWAQWVRSREDRGDFQTGPQAADKLYYSASIEQPLYHWGVISRNIESAKIRVEMDAGRTRQAYLLLVRDIRAQYLQLVMKRRMLEQARFAGLLADSNLKQVNSKQAQNTASAADVFLAELAQQRAALNVATAEDDFWSDSHTLARLTGSDPLSDLDVPLDYPTPAIEQDAETVVSLLARFIAAENPSNTDLQLALKQLDIAQNDLHANRMALRPKFNVVAGLTQDEQSFTANPANKYEVQSLFAGVNVRWALFDGFATRGRVKSGLARLRASELAVAAQKAALLDNAQLMGRQLRAFAMAVGIAEKELGSATNYLTDMRARKKTGEVSEADVNSAIMNLHDVTGKTLWVRYQYWTKLSELLGLIEADPINAQLPVNRS